METTRQNPERLFYRSPAVGWDSGLPLGSGTLGMMVFGGTEREELQLNEESLWSGWAADWDDPACRQGLPEIRRPLFARRLREAEALCRKYMVCQGRGSDDEYYGSFQTAASLFLESPAPDASGYERSLDLWRGAAETRFGPARRVHTVSHRYQVTASRVTGPGPLRLTFYRRDCSVRYRPGELLVTDRFEGPENLRFCTLVSVESEGPCLPEGDALLLGYPHAAVLWTCTATTYRSQEDPEAVCRRWIAAAREAGFDAVLADETAWMTEALGRCTLELPSDPALEVLPTDERLERMRATRTRGLYGCGSTLAGISLYARPGDACRPTSRASGPRTF